MLTSLHIRDFAIIDQLDLELAPGMTALTGETGAGKSIQLIDDGTILSAARNLTETGIPVLGVNFGRLGFLADVSPDEMHERLTEILAGQ